jgi:hypothetical protein
LSKAEPATKRGDGLQIADEASLAAARSQSGWISGPHYRSSESRRVKRRQPASAVRAALTETDCPANTINQRLHC